MSEALFLSIAELGAAYRSRSLSPVAVTRQALDRIAARDHKLNSFITVLATESLAQAASAERELAAGTDRGPLHGVPIAIKDLADMAGAPTTYASRAGSPRMPKADAPLVARLRAGGAVILGKTNLLEYAYGAVHPDFGQTNNPWDPKRTSGGSSGGSAAAVAANLAVATLGTDTGGSIRQPASFCGVVGVLPTYGRVSRYGLIAFASSLDRVGPLAANVCDAATLLGVIAGHDPHDATCSPAPVPDYAAESDRPAEGLRIGVPCEYFAEGLDPEVRAAVEQGIAALKAAGCAVKPVALPHTKYAVPVYYLIATAEASSNLARFDGVRYGYRSPDSETLSAMYRHSRDEGFGVEVKRRILLGTYALSAGYYDAYYRKAQQVRRLLAEEFLRAFAEVDAIVTPTAPMPAFKLGEKTGDPLAMYLADVYTVTASLAGICGVNVPCGQTQTGLPIGMQVLAAHFNETTAFRVARAVEAAGL